MKYTTDTGKKTKLSPDQEKAMMSRGKVLIAAGAGSGKTRVLAAKVAYHANELGVNPKQILATSFTTKATAELIQRVKDFGVNIEDVSGFGTTHSVAGKILNSMAPSYRRTRYFGKNEWWNQITLVKLAMQQVSFNSIMETTAPDPECFWEDDPRVARDTVSIPMALDPQYPVSFTEHSQIMDRALLFYDDASRKWSQGPAGWVRKTVLPFLHSVKDRDPGGFSWKQRKMLVNMLAKIKPPITQIDTATPIPKVAASKSGLENYVYYKRPANQWFNRGREMTRKLKKGGEKLLPIGGFKNAISVFKGKGISPSEAWAGIGPFDPHSTEAAVYGAYEWLMSADGEPSFVGCGDLDDLLIDAVTALSGDPQILQEIQKMYKVILVDEAQDLNQVQYFLFGLISGELDPDTMEPKESGDMTADTYSLIGDDRQCVDGNTKISTPEGMKAAKNLKMGDKVLSYRNGKIKEQILKHVTKSGWDHGIKITTQSGKTLIMSPNHKIWATEPITLKNEVAVYLMYRPKFGFRVGMTNKGKTGGRRGGDYKYSYGSRTSSEKAERLWILKICSNREDALYYEEYFSLTYGIPTAVFRGGHRGLNQQRIIRIFKQFGTNGEKLLKDRFLSFGLPHWMSQSYSKHGSNRKIIHLIGHSSDSTQVSIEWEGSELDTKLQKLPKNKRGNIFETIGNKRRIRRYFANYREALIFANILSKCIEAPIRERLSLIPESLPLMTAAGLFPNMEVAINQNGQVVLDKIISVDKNTTGTFIDLDVEDASNFFGNDILSHNSIYQFRGAEPDEFIKKSDLSEEKGSFNTRILDLNYRSGQDIIHCADQLISNNKHQVPMVCKADIKRNGSGTVIQRTEPTIASAASSIADDIEFFINSNDSARYSDFGIGVRSNSEAYLYSAEMIKRGIPFKSNVRFFKDTNTKALIAWLTIAEKGLKDTDEEIQKALVLAAKSPRSLIGQKFFDKMKTLATGGWGEWLTSGGWEEIYSRGEWAEYAEHFTENVKKVTEFTGSPLGLVSSIMTLTGIDDKTMQQTMIQGILDNDRIMGDLSSQSESGVPSENMVLEQAMAPIEPLLDLMKDKDELGPTMEFIRTLQHVNEQISSADTVTHINRNAVTIGTVHSWKGLEVRNMYVPMIGGKFPRIPKKKDTMPECSELWSERRLAYVAITRAMERCVMINIPNSTGVSSQFINESYIQDVVKTED